MKGKKGQMVLYVLFFMLAIVIITMAAVMAPMGVLFNSKMYEAGEDILDRAQPSIDSISDSAVRTQINNSISAAKSAGATNININANIFQYSWIPIVFITAIVIFLQARRLIEVGAGGFI